MICNICGKEQGEGRISWIVTGNMLSNSTKTDEITYSPITNQTFGEFQKIEFWFCQKCWRSRLREKLDTSLKFSTIAFVVGSIVSILGFITKGEILAGLGLLAVLIGLIGMIPGGFRKWKTDFSTLDMQIEDSESLFYEFNDVIPGLVYKAKGKTWYWQGESWQAAVDKKPHSNSRTYESQGPEV